MSNDTTAQARLEWLNWRKSGIGGSDMAAIMGESSFGKTIVDVWKDKTSRDVIETPDNQYMKMGRLLEPVVAQLYEERESVKLTKGYGIRSATEPLLLGTPDYLAPTRGVEIKTASSIFANQYGEEYTDQIPAGYLMQVHHYMTITKLTEWDVAVLIGGNDFRVYRVKENPALSLVMTQQARSFWDRFVMPGVAPEITTSREANLIYPNAQRVTIEATPQIAWDWNRLCELRDKIRQLETEEDATLAKIQAAMGVADSLANIEGERLATWTNERRRTASGTA